MRAELVDPSAFTPPYDRALAAALARAGVEVELLTSRFLYGPVPVAEGYRVRELFYRRSAGRGLDAPARRAFKLAEHLPGMARLRRATAAADVVHYQWLTLPGIDSLILPPARPRVMTAHYVLPPAPSRRQLASARRAFGAMDAVIAHSEHGAGRLRDEVELDPGRVRVIPHGAFDYLTDLPEVPLPTELEGAEGPVILFFGLLRPYKGIDVLLEAFRRVEGAELWIVGNPRMELAPLRALAVGAEGRVRFLPRFVEDAEIPAIMRRADVLVLPYLDAEHSGVLYTGLAFGKPMVLSAVGGFPEVAAQGNAVSVPPGDPDALAAELRRLTADDAARAALSAAALAAASGPYSWDAVARQTLALYEELLEARR
ncbi:MAG TPA: glycosyltransferase family 4 protein [Solirubrobacterales bacterium]